jgi:hypothetical protein
MYCRRETKEGARVYARLPFGFMLRALWYVGPVGRSLGGPAARFLGRARSPPPTERQTHGTGIRDRATLGDPTLAHEIVHHLTQCRHPHTQRGCGVRQFDVRMTTQEERSTPAWRGVTWIGSRLLRKSPCNCNSSSRSVDPVSFWPGCFASYMGLVPFPGRILGGLRTRAQGASGAHGGILKRLCLA